MCLESDLVGARSAAERAAAADDLAHLLDGVDGVVVHDESPVLLDLVLERRLRTRRLRCALIDLRAPASSSSKPAS